MCVITDNFGLGHLSLELEQAKRQSICSLERSKFVTIVGNIIDYGTSEEEFLNIKPETGCPPECIEFVSNSARYPSRLK